MKIEFVFNSSSSGTHTVEADTLGMKLQCHCQAGQCHQLCKHIRAFFKDDPSMLHFPAQHELFHAFSSQLNAMRGGAWAKLQEDLETASSGCEMEYSPGVKGRTRDELKTEFVKILRL